MVSRRKILIGFLIIVIILVAGWWMWDSQGLPITISGKLLEPVKINWLYPIETSQKLPFGITLNLVPNSEAGITQKVLISFIGKEIEAKGRIIFKEVGSSESNCEESQIGCLRKIKVILPNNIRVIEEENTEVIIATDKEEYEQGGIIKIKIFNYSNKTICFESCNTYYFQKKDGLWKDYLVKTCEINLITKCIDRLETREFEREFSGVDFSKGIYRIAIPIYIGCENREWPCEENKTIYSNEFIIK